MDKVKVRDSPSLRPDRSHGIQRVHLEAEGRSRAAYGGAIMQQVIVSAIVFSVCLFAYFVGYCVGRDHDRDAHNDVYDSGRKSVCRY